MCEMLKIAPVVSYMEAPLSEYIISLIEDPEWKIRVMLLTKYCDISEHLNADAFHTFFEKFVCVLISF